jgi:hypothetical protein
MKSHFELTADQILQIKKWKDTIDRRVVIEQQQTLDNWEELTSNGKYPYYGAIGGELTYCFCPNSIGETVTVIHNYTNEKLDITDYSTW